MTMPSVVDRPRFYESTFIVDGVAYDLVASVRYPGAPLFDLQRGGEHVATFTRELWYRATASDEERASMVRYLEDEAKGFPNVPKSKTRARR